jgi:PEGA domain
MTRTIAQILIYFAIFATSATAQSNTAIVISWPTADKPTLKLTFSKFIQQGLVNGQGIYTSDVTVQNLSDAAMPRSVFTVYVSDKSGTRIGSARLQLRDIPPFRTQNATIQFSAAGAPANLALLAGKTIPLRVLSVPPGANLKIDGEDAGVTPKFVDFTIGEHTLEFAKEGYATGSTALTVGSDELPGGSVSFELGGITQDTVELRDGTVLLGDVLSMSMISVVISIDGKEQKYERNQIKKIMLVQRVIEQSIPEKTPKH